MFVITAKAQQKNVIEKPLSVNTSYTDSLLVEFENSIYTSFYTPKFWSKNTLPTFTVLKIDIDKNGNVTGIRFSDSADTAFVNAFLQRPKFHNDKSTLEKYAKAKSYSDCSILIPVSYEPSFGSNYSFLYRNMDSLMKFDSQYFIGKAIILAPIQIRVLSEHNM